jgi:hypothetical protein
MTAVKVVAEEVVDRPRTPAVYNATYSSGSAWRRVEELIQRQRTGRTSPQPGTPLFKYVARTLTPHTAAAEG